MSLESELCDKPNGLLVACRIKFDKTRWSCSWESSHQLWQGPMVLGRSLMNDLIWKWPWLYEIIIYCFDVYMQNNSPLEAHFQKMQNSPLEALFSCESDMAPCRTWFRSARFLYCLLNYWSSPFHWFRRDCGKAGLPGYDVVDGLVWMTHNNL